MAQLQNTVILILKVDSPPSANNGTPQKFLWWFAIVLSIKVWKQIFENDYYGFKRED